MKATSSILKLGRVHPQFIRKTAFHLIKLRTPTHIYPHSPKVCLPFRLQISIHSLWEVSNEDFCSGPCSGTFHLLETTSWLGNRKKPRLSPNFAERERGKVSWIFFSPYHFSKAETKIGPYLCFYLPGQKSKKFAGSFFKSIYVHTFLKTTSHLNF
jgi:hypothetical protein